MTRAAGIVERMRRAPQNVRYDDLAKVCDEHFGAARQRGTSHAVYATPWVGDPRVNIQRGHDGKAEVYQVLAAIDRLAQESEPAPGEQEGADDD